MRPLGWPPGLDRWLARPRVVPALLILAVALRVGWAVLVPNEQVSDFAMLRFGARALLVGDGYLSRETGLPTAFHPVGYPLLLSAFWRLISPFAGPTDLSARLLNAALSLAILLLTVRLAHSRGGATVSRRALLLMTPWPSFVVGIGLLGTELPATALVIGLCALLDVERPGPVRWLGAGALAGLAALVRPTFLPLGLVIGGLALWLGPRPRSTRLALALTVPLTAALIVLPMTLRNHRQFGGWPLVSTNGAINLWIGNFDRATGGYLNPPELDRIRARFAPGDEAASDRAVRDSAVAWIGEHPLRSLALVPARWAHLAVPDGETLDLTLFGIPSLRPLAHGSRLTTIVLLAPLYALLWLALALDGWSRLRRWRLGERPTPATAAGFAIVLVVLAVHAPLLCVARHQIPLVPVALLSLASWRRFPPRRARELAFSARKP